MRKVAKHLCLILCSLLLMGCEKKQTNLANLDISGIEDNIDVPEILYEMKSPSQGQWNDEKIYNHFPQIVEKYGGNPEGLEDMFITTWIEGERVYIPIDQHGDEDMEGIRYCTPSLYIDMTNILQLMIYHPEEVERITGEEIDYKQVWLPNEHAKAIQAYVIGEDDITGISYCLDGEVVSLEESIAYLENELTNNDELPLISKQGFQSHVSKVEIYQFGDNYAYYFTTQLYYDGIKVDDQFGDSYEKNQQGNFLRFVGTINKYSMFSKNVINGMYTFDWLNEKQEEVKTVKGTIDYHQALEILSNHLSQDYVFEVVKAELVYNFFLESVDDKDGFEGGNNRIVPHWQFEISTEGMQQYNRIYILIDIQTGEVIERYA